IDYIFETEGIYLRDREKEYFYILLLNNKNSPIETLLLSSGSSNATVVDSKEIVRLATIKNASSVIIFHNHPSGDTEPSRNDIELTKKIKSALELLNIHLLDHIITGKDRDDSFSFAKNRII
ncbi:MAG: JAB domain-containing protein, partial [Elusimicrobiales bacterium]